MIKYLLLFLCSISLQGKSICYGTTGNGYLKNGVKLPSSGKNFVSYGLTGEMAGRTFVHSTVHTIVVDAYKILEKTAPDKVFKYAETGFKNGGRFRPHKTHRNGLSVDFMVPVVDQKGKSLHLPTSLTNKLGYSIEFDRKGNYKHYKLDYEAMGAHLIALYQAAKKQKVTIKIVIFDPVLQKYLFKTKYGVYLKKKLRFSKRRAWVRHDEHYHIDFRVPCRKLKR